jgi:hypothetical protein
MAGSSRARAARGGWAGCPGVGKSARKASSAHNASLIGQPQVLVRLGKRGVGDPRRFRGTGSTGIGRSMVHLKQSATELSAPLNRDREGPRGLPPPTPPDVRVTYPAVRWLASGCAIPLTGASSPGVPAARSSQGPTMARPLAGRRLAAPPQATTRFHRSGLPTVAGGTMPSADCCRAVREACAALGPSQDTSQLPRGQRSDLPCRAAGLIKHRPIADGGLCCGVPAYPGGPTPRLRFVSRAPHVRSTLPSDPTSR